LGIAHGVWVVPVDNSCTPSLFYISVAFKGLRVYVSGLESTLTGISMSVDSKWLIGEVAEDLNRCEKEKVKRE
jgi:hypothetical protein